MLYILVSSPFYFMLSCLTSLAIWDILMDWSLLQPNASKRFLRDVRGYKNPNYYYAVMILDPILRFNWIFYAMFIRDLQHSTIVAFLVAFSEATRRGLWVIFRVENEHCSNVARFKASRDVPLPYDLPCQIHEQITEQPEETHGTTIQSSPNLSRLRSQTGTALEAQHTNESTSTLRRRLGPIRALTRIVANAHTQDFEKKRKPGTSKAESEHRLGDASGNVEADRCESSSDDDDEQNEEDVLDAQAFLRERSRNDDERAT
jgi:xenotropic and polytropic retrovirus receptor 1